MSATSRLEERLAWLKHAHANADRSVCWEWPFTRTTSGYGRLGDRQAHRVSYEMANGPFAPGMLGCHRCDNPPCVNPDHIFAGTIADNFADMVSKGRQTRGETHPRSKLSPDQVLAIRGLLAEGRSCRSIGKQFDVDRAAIENIKRGLSWAWMTERPPTVAELTEKLERSENLADQLAAALREARYRLRLIGLDLDDDGIATLATYEARRES